MAPKSDKGKKIASSSTGRVKRLASKRGRPMGDDDVDMEEEWPDVDPRDFREFYDSDSKLWMDEHGGMGFVVETDVDAHLDSELMLGPMFAQRRWETLLDLPMYYYPRLVKLFYANMMCKDYHTYNTQAPPSFTTFLWGRRIEVDLELFGELGFDVTTVERRNKIQRIQGAKTFNFGRAGQDLGFHYVKRGKTPGRTCWRTTYGPVRMHALIYLLSRNVNPRLGNYNEARKIDLFHCHHLRLDKERRNINIAAHIIRQMQEIGCTGKRDRNFIFPRLITKILMKKFPPQDPNARCLITDDDILNEAKMRELKMKRNARGEWQPVPYPPKFVESLFHPDDLYVVGFDCPEEHRVFYGERQEEGEASQPQPQPPPPQQIGPKLNARLRGLENDMDEMRDYMRDMRIDQHGFYTHYNTNMASMFNFFQTGAPPPEFQPFTFGSAEWPTHDEGGNEGDGQGGN